MAGSIDVLTWGPAPASSGHGAVELPTRLPEAADAVRDHLASALDLVVHVERTVAGSRQVVEVAEVAGGQVGIVIPAGPRGAGRSVDACWIGPGDLAASMGVDITTPLGKQRH